MRHTLVPGARHNGYRNRFRSRKRTQSVYRKVALMTLLSGLLMVACAGSGNPVSLDSTAWEVTAIGDTRPVGDRPITLIFEDGSVRGSAGCNTYGGDFRVDGDRIVFEKLFATLMACPEPEGIMEQEQAYLAFLGEVDSFQESEGRLRLFRPDGEAILFIAAEIAE